MQYTERSITAATYPLTPSPETNQRPLLGIGLKVASIVFFVTMMITIKLLHEEIFIGQIIFVRSIIGLLTVYVCYRVMNNGNLQALRIKSVRNHLPWALSSACAMTMWFVAITLIPLPEATAISFTMPLLVVAFAWLILGERVRLVRAVAVASGLVGVTIIVWPRLGIGADYGSVAAIGAALSLTAAIFWAFAQICLRKLSRTESAGSSVISFSIATLALSALTLPLSSLPMSFLPIGSSLHESFSWTWPSAGNYFWLLICGIAGGLGQLTTAGALRFATPVTIAPFEYLAFPIATLAAMAIFGERADANIWWGLPFIIAGGLLVIYREYYHSRRNHQAPR